jgi:hypothetical protein
MRAPQDEVLLTLFSLMVQDRAGVISMIKKGALVDKTKN